MVFILATTELHKIPATILSRVQRFEFKSIKTQDIKAVSYTHLDVYKRQVLEILSGLNQQRNTFSPSLLCQLEITLRVDWFQPTS